MGDRLRFAFEKANQPSCVEGAAALKRAKRGVELQDW